MTEEIVPRAFRLKNIDGHKEMYIKKCMNEKERINLKKKKKREITHLYTWLISPLKEGSQDKVSQSMHSFTCCH